MDRRSRPSTRPAFYLKATQVKIETAGIVLWNFSTLFSTLLTTALFIYTIHFAVYPILIKCSVAIL